MPAPNSLADLLSSKQPQFQTHQGLLVLGLQNDFVSPDGKLPVNTESGFVGRIAELAPKFRELAGDVIWVRSEFSEDVKINVDQRGEMVITGSEAPTDDIEEEPAAQEPGPTPKKSRTKSKSRSSKSRKKAMQILRRMSSQIKLDGSSQQSGESQQQGVSQTEASKSSATPGVIEEELFLSPSATREPCCMKGSKGAEFADQIKNLIDKEQDILVTKSHYSAFMGTSLLMTLRTKLITELYVCGCMTNISVFSTTQDAVRHGFKIHIIDDCLGYRKMSRHEEALMQMVDHMGAQTISSLDILTDLDADPDENSELVSKLEAMVDKLDIEKQTGDNLEDAKRTSAGKSATQAGTSMADLERQLGAIKVDSRSTRPQTSRGKERATMENTPSVPSGAAKSLKAQQSMPNLKTRIRMRPKLPKDLAEAIKESPAASQKTLQAPKVESVTNAKNSTQPPPTSKPGYGRSKSTTAVKPDDSELAEPDSSSQTTVSISPTTSNTKGKKTVQTQSPTNTPKVGPSGEVKSSTPESLTIKASATASTLAGESPRPTKKEASKDNSTTSQASSMSKNKNKWASTAPVLGPGDQIGDGDSSIEYNLLSDDVRDIINSSLPLSKTIFHGLYNEVQWQKMFHATGEVPRLVAVQGQIEADGSKPVYRHPSDQSPPLLPFTAKVKLVKEAAEKVVGHPLNHVLIQLYRDGKDYISEHSDKTLDIVRGSKIVNASFGAKRTMRLRRKRKPKYLDRGEKSETVSGEAAEQRESQRIPMPHNSLFVLGLETNRWWLHGINADKRLVAERDEEELAYDGMRISLTFRHIGTFLSADEKKIWGQGAKNKSQDQAASVIDGDKNESEQVIIAFGKENHEDETFDWDQAYGGGFDVLHFKVD
jgi:nicotinamidase-related amidase/alkylated DNA repair dioxygenase AlkB